MRLIHFRRWPWAALGSLVLIGLTALIVLSITALQLDRAEVQARRAAAVEENLRLALWRIDTAWAPLVAQEGLRQVVGYTSALAPEQTSVAPTDSLVAGSVPPSQLAILARFQWSPSSGNNDGETQSGEHTMAVDFLSLWQQLPAGATIPTDSPALLAAADIAEDHLQRSRSAVEFQNRSQAVLTNNAMMQQANTRNGQLAMANDPAPPPLVACWQSGQMLLARRTQHRGQEVLQGCLIDWDQLRRWSLNLITDLLPEAALEPVQGLSANGGPDMLAALPVRLIPGSLTEFDPPTRSSVPLTLAVAWTGVLMAGALGAVLLYGVLQLSERRAAFVSAVTHELRTPLTTFQLYTEMLSSGMIPDEATRRSYLETLRSEALRLNHLVDNVLAYARLERGRQSIATQFLAVEAVIDAVRPRLEQIAQRGEMTLVVEPSAAFAKTVRVNVSVVEQILLNLVDNACKYAAGAADRRILISVEDTARYVELRVCDHGPGLPAGGQWLRPFSKTAHQAAESAPGIGLGLALSRRLARQFGGSLEPGTTAGEQGACLVLRLPVANPSK